MKTKGNGLYPRVVKRQYVTTLTQGINDLAFCYKAALSGWVAYPVLDKPGRYEQGHVYTEEEAIELMYDAAAIYMEQTKWQQ